MDPDELLTEIRGLTASASRAADPAAAGVLGVRLAAAVTALDGWLSSGGDPPGDWLHPLGLDVDWGGGVPEEAVTVTARVDGEPVL